jgi:hypothetical protein
MYGQLDSWSLVSFVTMNTAGRSITTPSNELLEDLNDAELRRLVNIIVHDFNGDTSAYFASLKASSANGADREREESESKITRRFAKII